MTQISSLRNTPSPNSTSLHFNLNPVSLVCPTWLLWLLAQAHLAFLGWSSLGCYHGLFLVSSIVIPISSSYRGTTQYEVALDLSLSSYFVLTFLCVSLSDVVLFICLWTHLPRGSTSLVRVETSSTLFSTSPWTTLEQSVHDRCSGSIKGMSKWTNLYFSKRSLG